MALLLDIGSTNVKYRLPDGTMGSRLFPSPCVNDGVRFEVEIEQIILLVSDILRTVPPTDVFFSVQMHGYVLLKNGKPVTQYISWRDERGKKEMPRFFLSKEHGVGMKPNLPRLSIQTQRVDFDEFATLGSYIVYALTGRNATHVSDLCPSGFYDWVNRLAETVPFRLPQAKTDLRPLGEWHGHRIHPPIGDQQCAVLGAIAGVAEEESYVLNVGTASQLCCVVPGFAPGDYEARPFFGGKTLATITRLPGGGILKDKSDEEVIDSLVSEYKSALAALPKKSAVVIAGGAALARKPLFEEAMRRLRLPYSFHESLDALEGLDLLSKGELPMNKIGIMLSEIPHHSIPTVLKSAGLDYFILDYEHGGFDYEPMGALILNARLNHLPVIVRIPCSARKDIIKVLDMGADGLLLPMTSTKEDIEAVVRYAKYPPMGKRGISTMRAHTLYNPGDILDYVKEANERVKVYAQIETKDGVKNVEEILGVEGVAGVMIGPNDLSADIGCLGQKEAPEILEAIETVCKAATAAKKEVAIITGNKPYLDAAKQAGCSMFCIGSELNAIANYCKKIIADNR